MRMQGLLVRDNHAVDDNSATKICINSAANKAINFAISAPIRRAYKVWANLSLHSVLGIRLVPMIQPSVPWVIQMSSAICMLPKSFFRPQNSPVHRWEDLLFNGHFYSKFRSEMGERVMKNYWTIVKRKKPIIHINFITPAGGSTYWHGAANCGSLLTLYLTGQLGGHWVFRKQKPIIFIEKRSNKQI